MMTLTLLVLGGDLLFNKSRLVRGESLPQPGQLTPVTGPLVQKDIPYTSRWSAPRRAHRASCFIQVKMTKEVTYPSLDPSKPSVTVQTPQRWLGSGVLIDAKRGLVLTNWHVADDNGNIISREYKITFPNHEPVQGAFIVSDQSKDLAILQILGTKDLDIAAVVMTQEEMGLGERVWVIGSPYGLSFSLSHGIISMVGREVRIRMRYDKHGRRIGGRIQIGAMSTSADPGFVVYKNMIQVDAPINPGNSGGGLFTYGGRLIGLVNSGMAADGIGFAIPMTTIQEFLAQNL
jgi:S1-C subfamily serine protease